MLPSRQVFFGVLTFLSAFNFFAASAMAQSCPEASSTSFCGEQVIALAILSFTDLPDSFNFPRTTVSSSSRELFSNGNQELSPAEDDLLGVQDTRNSGGFEVQIQAEGTFTDGVHTIPLSNMYVATSVSSPTYTISNTSSPGGAQDGVIYESEVITKGVTAPLDTANASLGSTTTFTSNGASLATGVVTLMNGSLPSDQGRVGKMYQYVSFYLHLPASQAAGDYAVTLTYTLLDDTTEPVG